MNLFKFLEVDNHEAISKDISDYYHSLTSFVRINGFTHVIDHFDLTDSVPSLTSVFSKYNLDCVYAAFVVFDRNWPQIAHKDLGVQTARLLWPVEGCQGTIVKFYKVGEDKKQWIDGPEIKYHYYDVDHAEEISQYELTAPLIVNSTEVHKIYVDENLAGNRVSLYCIFSRDPVELLNESP